MSACVRILYNYMLVYVCTCIYMRVSMCVHTYLILVHSAMCVCTHACASKRLRMN